LGTPLFLIRNKLSLDPTPSVMSLSPTLVPLVTRLKELAGRFIDTNYPTFTGVCDIAVEDWSGHFSYPISFEFAPPNRYKLCIDEAYAPLILREEVFFLAFLEGMFRACPENSTKPVTGAQAGKRLGNRSRAALEDFAQFQEDLLAQKSALRLTSPGTVQVIDLPRTNRLNPSLQIATPADGFVEPDYYPLLTDMVDEARHIQLMGPPGVGKSFVVEHLAKKRKKKLFNLNCDCKITRAHLEGTKELRKGDTFFKRSGFAEAVVSGGWAKLDELNSAEPDAIISLNGVIANPRIINLDGEQFPVHKDFRLFVTYNPGLTGTKSLPESLEDRLFPIVVPHPTREKLEPILAVNGVRPSYCRPLGALAVALWKKAEERAIRYELSVRRLIEAGVLLGKGYSWNESIRYAVMPFVKNPNDRKIVEAEYSRF